MARYIDADKLDVVMFQGKSKEFIDGAMAVLEMIDDMPTEEVQPIVRGKCSISHGMYENRIWCNNCGFIKVITGEEENYNFCPKCGAIVEK